MRAAFDRTLAVRGLSPQARELADLYFFETLVRLHRASEGEPYTGLKSADTPVEPVVAAADEALAKGSPDKLVAMITEAAAAGLRERWEVALARQKHAEESVAAGRAFVAAYVEFVHYAERLHTDARGEGSEAH